MKRPLSTRLCILVATSLFAINAYSQALPDPGKDPVDPVDSISRSIELKVVHARLYEIPATPADNTSQEKLFNSVDNFSFYNPQEKLSSSIK